MSDFPIVSEVGAIILCGGESRRMGRDKAWLPFGEDATLLERTVRIVSEVVAQSSIVVVAAEGQELPHLVPTVTVVRDRWPDEGPLAGMATGFQAVGPGTKWALLCCCDLPFLQPSVLELLVSTVQQLGDNSACQAAIPRVQGLWQPLTAIYRTSLISPANDLLQRGQRRMTDLLEGVAVKELGEQELRQVDADLVSFRHCNTPEEYEELSRLAAR